MYKNGRIEPIKDSKKLLNRVYRTLSSSSDVDKVKQLLSSEKGEYRSFSPATNIFDAIEDGSIKLAIKTNPQIKSFS